MTSKKGFVLIVIGCIMILSGMSLSSYNMYVQNRAEKASEKISVDFTNKVKETDIEDKFITEIPKGEMKKNEVDGYNIVGRISYPKLKIDLPVINDWSYKNLNVSACRYSGSLQDGNLIIMAHNYQSHFGKLKKAVVGDEVYFEDGFGTIYGYTVEKTEKISGNNLEALVNNSYDMTLFTCTYSGRERIVIRLTKI